jgi:hypothetical protein
MRHRNLLNANRLINNFYYLPDNILSYHFPSDIKPTILLSEMPL